jgi:Transport and Golgi organisation 2
VGSQCTGAGKQAKGSIPAGGNKVWILNFKTTIMCTVVFVPGDQKNVLASLRDENPGRAKALAPLIDSRNDVSFLSPKDPAAGGTWIGINQWGDCIVLLNGGFENHSRQKSYRKSRGLIVTELLTAAMPVVEWSLMDLDNIEPFTLIVWSEKNLFQLVWDGAEKHRLRLDATQPHIWSSATLYTSTARADREEFFQNWIAMNPPVTKLSLLNFFKSFQNTENGFLINRNAKMKTLSYTFVEFAQDGKAGMSYYDFLNYSYHSGSISIARNAGQCPLPKDFGNNQL